ncbi:hypothetical protein [Lacisediminihabitans sp.]|uniref:hypothetical protein n=1 Tax=Lacisediminihabitans sp. TaxID=2787631 RepID=UPI00374DA934
MSDRVPSFVEVVVVHGMGHQRSSETLLEWAEPLIERIQWLAGAAAENQVTFGRVKADSSDEDEYVSGRVLYTDLEGGERDLAFGIREARWADAFLPMKPSQVFSWGVDFLWHTTLRLGTYFARVLRLGAWQLAELRRPPTPPAMRAILLLPLVLTFALAWLAVGVMWVLVIAISLLVAALLPALSILLIFPIFQNLLQRIVDGLVEFVGDVAVWTKRPVRAAAMRGVVRESLRKARASLDAAAADPAARTKLVVLAHSQGAAITADTLFDALNEEPLPRVDAFVSVGAAITLLGASRWPDGVRGEVVRAVNGAPRMAMVPEFNPVAAWASAPPTRWLNFWAIWDPFSAGPVSTSSAARIERWRQSYRWKVLPGLRVTEDVGVTGSACGPEEHPVHNTALPFTDHQSYSSNIPQVIDPVARLLLDLEPSSSTRTADGADVTLAAPDFDGRRAERLRNTLHVRGIKALGLHRLLVMAVAVAAVVLPAPAETIRTVATRVLAFLFAADPTTGWLGWLGRQSWLATVVIVAGVAIIGLWINARLWRYHRRKITWRRDGELAGVHWIGGLVLRAVLVAVLWWLLIVAAPGEVIPWLAIVAGLAGVALVVSPLLGLRPLVVPEHRG